MKVSQSVSSKGRHKGQTCYLATAENGDEKGVMTTFGMSSSKFGNPDGMKFYTYELHIWQNVKGMLGEGYQETNTTTEEEGGEDMDYDKMNVSELRKAVREKGWKGADVLSAKQTELVHFLNTGEKPVREGNGEVNMDEIGKQIAELFLVLGGKGGGVDIETLRLTVADEVARTTKRVVLTTPEMKEIDCGAQHEKFSLIAQMVQLGVNISLTGPAGSGKTTCCHNVAEKLEREFYCMSVGMQTTKSDLIGYMDAHGKYVPTVLYTAYKEGGLFLLDEADSGNANVLTILNALLANGQYIFPNGERVKKHEMFACIMAMNTYGRGADRLYVGRNQLDAATLDRFATIDFDYDENLELQLAGNDGWTKRVQAYRKAAFDMKERVVISPRASIFGAVALAGGVPQKQVEEMFVWKGMDNAIKSKIQQNACI